MRGLPDTGVDSDLGSAIVRTLAYGDVFDYPLSAPQIARYLIGCRAPMDAVERALACDPLVRDLVDTDEGWYFLRGRRDIVRLRRERGDAAARVWPRAIRYGRAIARLPFVRMVAVTGALAMDNPGPGSDIDYIIVTEPGRLWSARAGTIAVVRLVAPLGDVICPNYFVSDQRLAFDDQTLFTAHEVAQMVPVSGVGVYERLRRVNAWTARFLPNADGPPRPVVALDTAASRARSVAERLGRTRAGQRLERWEMTRKVDKLCRAGAGKPEAAFSADVCKGHMEGHGRRVLASFTERLSALQLPDVVTL